MTPATILGGIVGEKTAKLLPWIAGAVVVFGLVIALLLTRNTLSEAKRERDAERAAHAQTKAVYREAQAKAGELAQKRLREVESLYRRNADEAEQLHAAALADAGDAAERFIRANRVRAEGASCPSSGPIAPASGERAGVPAPVPADPVMVSADDVRACTGAVTYALEAHRWSLTLNMAPAR